MILRKNTRLALNIVLLVLFCLLVVFAKVVFDPFSERIFDLCGIYVILALSLNLINGFMGLFSLGHAGFMCIGAYVSALLTMTADQKTMNFFLAPIVPWLANVQLPFPCALIIAGCVAGIFGFLIGTPVLRLRDDYLAIATLGFAEIIRVVITNMQTITNGALGLKGVPRFATTPVVWGLAALATVFMIALVNSSFGRSVKAIRDNEIAAQAMGINVARVKITSFTISSFMAGIGGALLGHLMSTIDPRMFTFSLTYNIVLIVVLGGSGSITGSVISAVVITWAMEALRFLDQSIDFGFFTTPALPGLRMVVFSVMLMLVIIFRQEGLMGMKEFNWDMITNCKLARKLEGKIHHRGHREHRDSEGDGHA
jgi:branched-chain amino acid transport system permease protein